MVFLMPCSGHLLEHGIKAFEMSEQAEEFTAAPKPTPEAEAAAGFAFPDDFNDFDPCTHGLRLIEAMRDTPDFYPCDWGRGSGFDGHQGWRFFEGHPSLERKRGCEAHQIVCA